MKKREGFENEKQKEIYKTINQTLFSRQFDLFLYVSLRFFSFLGSIKLLS